MQMFGQISSGINAKNAADTNAAMLKVRAGQVEEKAKYDIDQLRRTFERDQGTKISKIAGSGLNLATFSDILADDELESFLERKAVRVGADIEKQDLRNQARAVKAEGRNARTSAFISAAATGVKGGFQYSQMGANPSTGVTLGTSDTFK